MQVGSATSPALGATLEADRTPRTGAGTSFAALLAGRGTRAPDGIVPATRTKLTTEEAREALTAAWTSHFGSPPTEETAAILTAQWAHETGHGQSMWNFNFAGLKGKGPTGLSVSQRTKEGYGASERTITDQFRAYESKEEGAADYLGLLARRYPGALDAAAQGDPEAFVRELKSGGYFTGSETAYVRSVKTTTAALLGREPTIDRSIPSPRTFDSGGITPHEGALASVPPSREGSIAVRSQEPRTTTLAPRATSSDLLRVAELGPETPSLESFRDALSRAALRIALAPEREEDRLL